MQKWIVTGEQKAQLAEYLKMIVGDLRIQVEPEDGSLIFRPDAGEAAIALVVEKADDGAY